ncbi:MAG TPA: Ig-like domain-containing protein, partial [Prosthecobacter sp.]|nr:Ig-like domain-containing protein [Prosthecobacter sp.]
GRAITDMGGRDDVASAVALAPDGGIVVAGTAQFADFDYRIGIARYNVKRFSGRLAVFSPANAIIKHGGVSAFGAVDLTEEKTFTFKIKNTGDTHLGNFTAALQGPGAAMFTVADPLSAVLLPGESTTFTVRYAPTMTPGLHTALLSIASNDLNRPSFDITLTGTGVAAPPLPVKTLAATEILENFAVLHGSIDAKGEHVRLFFDYGLTKDLGESMPASPAEIVAGSPKGVIPVTAALTDLNPHAKYFFRLRAARPEGPSLGASLVFTTGNHAPVAVDDSRALMPGATALLDVVANDLDEDGDVRSIASFDNVPASQGKVTKANGYLLFTAASGFTGVTFSYVVKDAFGATDSAEVVLSLGSSELDLAENLILSAGGSYFVNVTTAAGTDWMTSENVPWLSVTPARGMGSGDVTVTLAPNASLSERSAIIRIAGKDHLVRQLGVEEPSVAAVANVKAVLGTFCSIDIPTDDAPVTYSFNRLPPGFKVNHAAGVIFGIPTKVGSYTVVLTARNAAGESTPVGFTIDVSALQPGWVGAFHGIVGREPNINGGLGSRFELTTGATGACTGKIITGVTATPFKGQLLVNPLDTEHATLQVTLPRKLRGSLVLNLDFSASTQGENGSLAEKDHATSAAVKAWRNPWSSTTKATTYTSLHTFELEPASPSAEAPEGYGFGSFIPKSNGA